MPKKQALGNALIGIIFPHQLFEDCPLMHCSTIYLVEEQLFFRQFNFHKQKIAFHRATMKWYADQLLAKGKEVLYIDSTDSRSDTRVLIETLAGLGFQAIECIDPTDDWLLRRLTTSSKKSGLSLRVMENPLFINSLTDLDKFFVGRKRFFQADFYAYQRSSRNILMDAANKPLGGKWSLDHENRLKYPRNKKPPEINFSAENPFYKEAVNYTEKHYADNYGSLDMTARYPSTHEEARIWLGQFLSTRFAEFGPYEDAIVKDQHILHHSVLTPVLNTGLLSPQTVLNEVLEYASNYEIGLNTVEGFIRQLIGWREYMRAVYHYKGRQERTTNFWGFKRKLPLSFWSGTTGIEPVDQTIRKVLATGYCHHIERLMVMGNFMLLCEIDPDDVYRWFMEMFIDAYDWVMVPNVYGMSQFADGGIMSTKPYISGSNYILKMSDYSKGGWEKIWDALFWRFMHVHRSFFLQNPRLGLLLKTFDKMSETKKAEYLSTAETYLASLDT